MLYNNKNAYNIELQSTQQLFLHQLHTSTLLPCASDGSGNAIQRWQGAVAYCIAAYSTVQLQLLFK